MKPEVKKAALAEEFETPERCYISEIANGPEDEEVSIARARVRPGITTVWHRLRGISERYIIVEGTGRVDLRGMESTTVSKGDVVRIPADTPQRITNTGDEDLIFYCVCTPRFQQDHYETLE
jgi:mannose-6-phosphate isomerase-like protein (cupin superfamily)